MPKDHAQLVERIVAYADRKDVSLEAQKYIVESALEYLAGNLILPEGNVSGWPEEYLIGGFHAYVDQVIG